MSIVIEIGIFIDRGARRTSTTAGRPFSSANLLGSCPSMAVIRGDSTTEEDKMRQMLLRSISCHCHRPSDSVVVNCGNRCSVKAARRRCHQEEARECCGPDTSPPRPIGNSQVFQVDSTPAPFTFCVNIMSLLFARASHFTALQLFRSVPCYPFCVMIIIVSGLSCSRKRYRRAVSLNGWRQLQRKHHSRSVTALLHRRHPELDRICRLPRPYGKRYGFRRRNSRTSKEPLLSSPLTASRPYPVKHREVGNPSFCLCLSAPPSCNTRRSE